MRLKNSSNCKQKKEKEKKEVQWDEAIGLEERLWSEEESLLVSEERMREWMLTVTTGSWGLGLLWSHHSNSNRMLLACSFFILILRIWG